MTLKGVLRGIGYFAAGYFLAYLIYVPHGRSPIDTQWHTQFTEDQNHQRVMEYQNALPKSSKGMDTGEVSKLLDAQLKIEDLVVKSREAENAKWLPFTPLLSGVFGAILGFLAALWRRKSAPTPK